MDNSNNKPGNDNSNKGSSGSGWVGTIVFLIVLNLLSYIFHWGWFFY